MRYFSPITFWARIIPAGCMLATVSYLTVPFLASRKLLEIRFCRHILKESDCGDNKDVRNSLNSSSGTSSMPYETYQQIPYSGLVMFWWKIKTLKYNTQPLSCHGQVTLSNIREICPLAIPNQISFISMHVPSLVKIPRHLLKLLSRNENMGVSLADNSVKICPYAIPNQISTISMHIPSLVKFNDVKLSSENENMGVSRTDNSIKIWRNLPISNPKPDLHNINAHTKFGENPLMFTQFIVQKRKMDGRMDVRLTDGRTDRHKGIQRETIIPRHYRVVGYKKTKSSGLRQVKNWLRTCTKCAYSNHHVQSIIQAFALHSYVL